MAKLGQTSGLYRENLASLPKLHPSPSESAVKTFPNAWSAIWAQNVNMATLWDSLGVWSQTAQNETACEPLETKWPPVLCCPLTPNEQHLPLSEEADAGHGKKETGYNLEKHGLRLRIGELWFLRTQGASTL